MTDTSTQQFKYSVPKKLAKANKFEINTEKKY